MTNDYGSLLAIDDPKTLGLLSLGLRLMSTPGKFSTAFGQSGIGALQDVAQRTQMNRESARRDAEMKIRQQDAERQAKQFALQQAETERALAKRKALEDAYRSAIRTPEQQAMQRFGGPTNQAAAAAPLLQPTVDQSALIKSLMASHPVEAAGMLRPKPRKLTTVAPGASVIDESDPTKPLFTAPSKEKEDAFEQTLIKAGILPGTPEFQIFMRNKGLKESSHPQPMQIDLGKGQKGFDNILSLGEKFKSEPIYKDYQDVASAHRQIKVSLAQQSPIGDTAAATKIMKILDSGSVVRETELGMAMAAAGKMDRISNYVQMWVKGVKLTPQQRIDFANLADELAAATAQAYNARREHYARIGAAYQLDPDLALGKPASTPKVVKWDDLK
jgi:hypothetical protein